MIRLNSLTKRQQYLLNFLGTVEEASATIILQHLKKDFDHVARITVIRDLHVLMRKKLVQRKGRGRRVIYQALSPFLAQFFDMEEYFSQEPDKRLLKGTRLAFVNKNAWGSICDDAEIKTFQSLTDTYRSRLKQYNPAMRRKELERLTMEFSWKSSHLEGNTYTLLDTERLITEHKEAFGKKKEEALMILNHKTALEYAWKHASSFRTINIRSIEEFHSLIVRNLNIGKGLRKRPVGIVGTAYKPHDNIFQIREAIDQLCRLINALEGPFLKALVAIAGLSYIQPFEDGNKRTSRLVGNALLLAYHYCPLSYRSVDEIEYKKALILFYEQHTLLAFKELFLEQYEFAVKNYFL